VDVDAVDALQPRVLGLELARLDADAPAAGLAAHRRVEREARRRPGRGDLEPAHLVVLAEPDVAAHLVAELLVVEAQRLVLIADREHRDGDVRHGRGSLRGVAHTGADPATARNSSLRAPVVVSGGRGRGSPRWRG